MKTKDLKTGVAYVDKVGTRRYATQHKAVIVSLDHRYAKPSRLMQHHFRTEVEEAQGSSAAYLVIESWLHEPDEKLIRAAKNLTPPTPGEAWPFILSPRSMKREKFRWGHGGEAHKYKVPRLPSGLSVALWLPQDFDHRFESIEDSERRVQDMRTKAVDDLAKKRVSKKQRVQDLLGQVNDLNLEGISEAQVLNNDGKRRDKVTLSVDVLEALLRRVKG